jgi:hypothetical protein
MARRVAEERRELLSRVEALQSSHPGRDPSEMLGAWDALRLEAATRAFPLVEHEALVQIARLHGRGGDSFGAERTLHEAIAVASRGLGLEHAFTLDASLELAELLAANGRFDDAVGIAADARAVAVAAVQDGLLVGRATACVGRRLCESGFPVEGSQLIRRALDIVWLARSEAISARDSERHVRASLLGGELALDLAELPSDGTGPDRVQLRALASRWLGDASSTPHPHATRAACLLAMTWFRLAVEDAPFASTAARFAAFALRVLPPAPPAEFARIPSWSRELLASLGVGPPGVLDAFHLLDGPPDVVAVAHPMRGFYLAFRKSVVVVGAPTVGECVNVVLDERGEVVRVERAG